MPGKSNITVSWKSPFDGECPVTSYTVYYRVMERMTASAWKEVLVSNDQLQTTLQLKCRKMYEIAVTAWSSHGETTRNQSKQLVTTWGGKNFKLSFKKFRFFWSKSVCLISPHPHSLRADVYYFLLRGKSRRRLPSTWYFLCWEMLGLVLVLFFESFFFVVILQRIVFQCNPDPQLSLPSPHTPYDNPGSTCTQ